MVATTVDDIPFFMSGAQADGAFFSANVDTYDLQRIEVLRGPQGTLYGAAAEGGIIKYVTNLPNLNKVEGDVSMGGQIVDGGSNAGNIKGMINLPFWDNKAALRVSAVESQIPGWIDNPELGLSEHQWRQQLQLACLVAGPAGFRFHRARLGIRAAPEDYRQRRHSGGRCRGNPGDAAHQSISNRRQ